MGVGRDLWTELQAQYKKRDLAGYASLYTKDAVLTDPTGRHGA